MTILKNKLITDRLISLFIILLLYGLPGLALPQSTFDDYKKQYKADYARFAQTFETGVAKSEAEYEAYQKLIEKELKQFREQMEKSWGTFEERTRKVWVEYKGEGEIKYSVDFETGEGRVEILAENEQEVQAAKSEITNQFVNAINDRGTDLGIPTEKIPNGPVTEEPVLADQLNQEAGETDKQYAERVAEDNINTKKVTGTDGQERTVVYLNFKLAPDHIRIRARKVATPVYTFAERYQLDPALVFAVIHTESYFNPTAVSHANAYGLMQLVPHSGGRDAYRAVFKKDGIPTKKFLFKPENNVNLGCAYLDLVTNRYLQGIHSSMNRQYLAIAAYNGGIGNVARAYTGAKKIDGALNTINEKSPEENYNYLLKHLPYKETQNYLRNVVERSARYADWKESVAAKERK